MTVTPVNYGAFTRLSGTIAEVLGALSTQQVGATNIIWYDDDGTDAECVYRGTYQA